MTLKKGNWSFRWNLLRSKLDCRFNSIQAADIFDFSNDSRKNGKSIYLKVKAVEKFDCYCLNVTSYRTWNWVICLELYILVKSINLCRNTSEKLHYFRIVFSFCRNNCFKETHSRKSVFLLNSVATFNESFFFLRRKLPCFDHPLVSFLFKLSLQSFIRK